MTSSERKAVEVIDATIEDTFRHCPSVLIDIRTGHICHGTHRICTFAAEPTFQTLVLSMATKFDWEHIQEAVEDYFRYVGFSHKWDEQSQEPLFQHVKSKSVYNLGSSPTNDKLRKFCETVRDPGHRWAWSDTCCIDQTDSNVLNSAITSMYKWYENAVLMIALLENIRNSDGFGECLDDEGLDTPRTPCVQSDPLP